MDLHRALHRALPLLGLLLFGVALFVLARSLQGHAYQEVVAAMHALPIEPVALALALTGLNYFAMTGHDFLALRYLRKRLLFRRVALAAITAYAFSHNLGFSVVSGGSVRFRLYSTWGLSAIQITQLVLFATMTIWLGFFTVGGIVFVIEPLPVPSWLHLPLSSLEVLGGVLLALTVAYFTAALAHARLTFGGWSLRLPNWRIALAQIALSSFDWVLAASVLYVLLPPDTHVSFAHLVGVFLLAQFGGVASQVPGGLGVFESLVILLLAPQVPAPPLFGSLLVFRAIYYFLPLCLAAIFLATNEIAQRSSALAGVARELGRWATAMAPQVLAIVAFVSGALLLFSSATPEIGWRLEWLREVLPPALLDLSHFAGSLIGVALLFLARGLQRRLDGAYLVAAILLAGGIVTSLLKGLDYEEAIFLAVALALLLPARHHFYRKASLLSEPFTAGWIAAIFLVIGASVWLGFFSYRHTEYAQAPWWHVALSSDGPRFLRASVGAIVLALVLGIARLLRPGVPRAHPPSVAELERAQTIVTHERSTLANLALLGDKQLLFSETGNSFIMYGVSGHSWIALGDPVGSPGERRELAWRFYGLADLYGGTPVFYQVRPDNLPLYVDLGLTSLKIGEEARVALADFSLGGHLHKGLRHLHNRVQKAGAAFEVVQAARVPALIPQLQTISDAWLAHKRVREKHFSLGFFSPIYLQRFPLALIHHGGHIVAFANLWCGANHEELSIDLMRYGPDAPAGVMDFLLIELMQWGRAHGFHWFNLGMAPLSGLHRGALAPLWNQIAGLVYDYAEPLYGFQGLRQFKQKFAPHWEPRYLAYPGGIALAPVLSHLTALISGGIKGAFMK